MSAAAMVETAADAPNLAPLRRLTVARYLGYVGGRAREGALARIATECGEEFVVRLPSVGYHTITDVGPSVDCMATLFMRAADLPVPERVLLDVPPGLFADAFRRMHDAELRQAWASVGCLTSGSAFHANAAEGTPADLQELLRALSPPTVAKAVWMDAWLRAQDRKAQGLLRAAGALWSVDYEDTPLLDIRALRTDAALHALAQSHALPPWALPAYVGDLDATDTALTARFTCGGIDAALALIPDELLAARTGTRGFDAAEVCERIRRVLALRLTPPRAWAAWLIQWQQLEREAAA